MKSETSDATTLRLVMCMANGQPSEPGLQLPATVQSYATACASLYERVGFVPPWVSYIVLDGDVPVGGGAFVGPATNGFVEIAYYTLPSYENQGVATFAAAGLVDIARQSETARVVTAKTLPLHNASTAILNRLGFVQSGIVIDEDVGEAWEWRLAIP